MVRLFHLPDAFKTYNFLLMIDTETNDIKSIRLLSVHHLQLDKSLSAAVEIVGVHWKTIQVWVSKFRKFALSSVCNAQQLWSTKKNNCGCGKMAL